jgi:toxin ParE1/3/4
MVGGEVRYSARARRDAVQLALWIARDGGEARAGDVIDRITLTLERLARRPKLGRLETAIPGEPRVFSVRPWKIIYRPLQDGTGVLVLRILDSRQDLAALLGKKT